ncbi:MAG TPA: hypothetical protein VGM50_11710 [Gemmatimonadaceae bacterium]|jgi:hypothetical protein
MSLAIAQQLLASYLFAYITLLTIALGALLQVMISHVSGARWFDGLRPTAMKIAGTLPWLAVFALPIVIAAPVLYPWSDLARIAPDLRATVAQKHAWLNVPFFAIRSVIYVVIWSVVEEMLRRRKPDDPRGYRAISAGGLVAVGITLTFASFDWIMSLEPEWYSTIYGVYVFAGGILSALGLIAFVGYRDLVHAPPALASGIPDSRLDSHERQTGSLGKLLLTFAIFWGYIAFSQYLIVWIGNLPSELTWYLRRTRTTWGILAILVGVSQFAVPFLALLGYEAKRKPKVLVAVGMSILIGHIVDTYWLVMPALRPTGIAVSWSDVVALVLVAGALAAVSAR